MTRFWIGCSGWQYPEWKSKFYPKELPKSQWFEYYTSIFNTVEINYSFYHNLQAKYLKKWRDQAPKNFRYSLKANRVITHYKKFNQVKRQVNHFYALAEILEEKLGCLLFQFPENFHYSEGHLARIIQQLQPKQPNVVEFRHASWWRDDVIKAFKQHKITFCSLVAPDLPRELVHSGPRCYLRFHGKKAWYRDSFRSTDLSVWLEKIRYNHFKEAWIYFNNTAFAYAATDAERLLSLIK